jgi:type 2 lantibiotic biosynthesis protein LanM
VHGEPWPVDVRALSLAERHAARTDATRASLSPEDAAEGARTVRWWERTYFPGNAAVFTRRLSADGFNRRTVLPYVVAGRQGTPAGAAPSSLPTGADGGPRSEHGPLVHEGVRRIAEALHALESSGVAVDGSAIEEQFENALIGRLNRIAMPTFAMELQIARLAGRLHGRDPQERFRNWADGAVLDPAGYHRMVERYPALRRALATVAARTVGAWEEMLQRLGDDWVLLGDLDRPSGEHELIGVEPSSGDTHAGGRAVMFLRFSSGWRVVYKPRPMAVDVHYYELLRWLQERGLRPALRTVGVLDRGTHGWMELIASEPCQTDTEVKAFYQRQGALLLVLYLLEAVDSHAENLIAAGSHPVLVDLEALFQARPAGAAVGARRDVFEGSVLATGVLPIPRVGTVGSVDLSGLADTAGQRTSHRVPEWQDFGTDRMRLVNRQADMKGLENAPRHNGRTVRAIEYVDDIVAGFSAAYQLVLAHRSELAAPGGPLLAFHDDRVRHVLRNTTDYGVLLDGSYHPSCLRDAIHRDFVLDCLWLQTSTHPHLARVIQSEREDLWDGDIPAFSASVSGLDLADGRGRRIASFFETSGMERVLTRLRRLDGRDLARQVACIKGTVCTVTRPAEEARMAESPDREATADELLEAAVSIGERLSVLAFRREDEAFWTGQVAMPTGGAMWNVVSGDLYEGAAGIALFLAHLAAATGRDDFEELARAAANSVRSDLRSADLPMSLGAFTGVPGMLYGLSRLAALWNDAKLGDEVAEGLDHVSARVRAAPVADLVSGVAGCAIVMLRLAEDIPSCAPRALDLATRCGRKLLRMATRVGGEMTWPPANPSGAGRPLTGLSHGAAGIAWALGELAVATGDGRFGRAASEALRYEAELLRPGLGNWPDFRVFESPAPGDGGGQYLWGWCHGAPGIGLARMMMRERCPGVVPEAVLDADVDIALASTEANGFNDGHCLCHGDLGNAELFVVASRVYNDPSYLRIARRQGHAVLTDAAGTGAWRCNRRDFTELPGLMMGIAGIGYGLLRLRDPLSVPSVLTLG